MSKLNLTKFASGLKTSLVKHSPEILTGIGIAGMITTTVLAVKATPKAMSLIEKEKNRRNREIINEATKNGEDTCPQISKLTAIDTIKVTWKCYMPAAITGTASIACLIGASSVHAKRNAMLATAYKLSETALTEYREKVVETIGEKKEEAIREELAKDKVKNTPVSESTIIMTGNGDTLCMDYLSGRYFKSDIEKIKKAINEVNHKLLSHSYVSLNELYFELGLDGSEIGAKMGWNSDMGLIDPHYTSQLDENGTPCLVVSFENPPKYDFDRFL